MTFEDFIPPRSKKVLEVIGEQDKDFQDSKENFLAIQPDCNYTVTKNFSDVKEKFDTIIFQSAVIGNLKNSDLVALIKSAAKNLNPKGTLIFTLDNIAFVENVMAILKGEPTKFKINLTLGELENSVEKAGAKVFRSLHASRKIGIPRKLFEISEVDVSAFAHIVTATLEKLPPKTVIQTLIGEKLVCAPIRIHMPNNFITTEPGFSAESHLNKNHYEIYSGNEKYQNKIFINQRISSPSFTAGKKFFEQLRAENYLYLSEMDDKPDLWQKDYEKSGWINFVGVHAIQTSTEYLADFLRQFNPNVKVFENQLKKIQSPRNFSEEFQQKNRPVTIFFGALNRDEDFAEILPVINDIAKTFGEKILFKIVGKQKLFNSIETENKILLGKPEVYDGQYISYEEYENALHTSDIALLPLLDTEFNRSKSDLKFIECASGGAVVLASPVVYSKTVRDGENGFIFKDLREFDEKLRLLITDKNKRRKVAENAYNYVKKNRLMSQHYEERIFWYRELFAKLPELNKETQARIEKIAPNFKDEQIFDEEKISAPQKNEGLLGPNNEIMIPV